MGLTGIIILVVTPPLILITFLPAFIELKKPKDGGPRLITAEIPKGHLFTTRFSPVVNIEEEQTFDRSLIQAMPKIIAVFTESRCLPLPFYEKFRVFPLILGQYKVPIRASMKRIKNIAQVGALFTVAVSFSQQVEFFTFPDFG